MTKEELLELVEILNKNQTETLSIEAKSANLGNPGKYYDTISSFANTIGGTILFGVEEKKRR